MSGTCQIQRLSYQTFIKGLHALLKSSGIVMGRSTILAEVHPEKNRSLQANPELKQQIGRVILYVEEHLAEEMNLDKLAREVSLSKYQLIRRFREEEGTTPWKFIIHKRIEKVKELLEEGVSPGQAALEAGFYDQSHLNRVFREEVGSTPKVYQEKNFRNRN